MSWTVDIRPIDDCNHCMIDIYHCAMTCVIRGLCNQLSYLACLTSLLLIIPRDVQKNIDFQYKILAVALL